MEAKLATQKLDKEFEAKPIINTKLHIACGSYSYLEVELPNIKSLDESLRLAEALQRRDEKLRFDCPHLFYEELTSLKGKKYKKCFSCGRMNFGGEWIMLNNKKEDSK